MKKNGKPGYRRKYQMELIADILGISRIALDRRLRRRGLTSSHEDLVEYMDILSFITPIGKYLTINNKKQK